MNSTLDQKKMPSGPKCSPTTSGPGPDSKNSRPGQQGGTPLPSSSTPVGQKDSSPQQQSRSTPHQKKISTNKHVAVSQKKAVPNQGISRPNNPSQKKIPPWRKISATILDSTPYSKNVTPNQQGTPSLSSSGPCEPSSFTSHQDQDTLNQQMPEIQSNPTYSQTNQQFSNSVALQEKIASRPPITNETNHKVSLRSYILQIEFENLFNNSSLETFGFILSSR